VRERAGDKCIGISDHPVVWCWARVFAASPDAAVRRYATSRLRYVTGHISPDLCGANSTFSGLQCELLAIVRHPVDRAISDYTFVASGEALPGEEGQAVADELLAKYPTVQSMLESLANREVQTGVPWSFALLTTALSLSVYSSGQDAISPSDVLWPGEWPQPDIDPWKLKEMVARAKDTLKSRYSALGTTEQFKDFEALLSMRYGIAPANLPCEMVLPHGVANTGQIQSHTDLAPELRKRLEVALSADIEVYNYAADLAEKHIAEAGKYFENARRALGDAPDVNCGLQ